MPEIISTVTLSTAARHSTSHRGPTRSSRTTPTPRSPTLASSVPRTSSRRSRPRSRSRCWLTTVQIGDRISQINGRDVSLLVNAGIEQGEAPSYPFVVGLTWDFQGSKQSTTLQLSDRRLEPQRA